MAKTRFIQQNVGHNVGKKTAGKSIAERVRDGITPPEDDWGTYYISQGDDEHNIRMYLKYEYLPVRDFGLLIKSVSELYELVYFTLYEERVKHEDILVLKEVHIGNSIDAILTFIKEAKPPKKVRVALAIVLSLISGVETYDGHQESKARIQRSEIITEAQKKTEDAKAANYLALAKKAEAEARRADMEALYIKHQIDKDSIKRINNDENNRKIARKTKTIVKIITQKPITYTTINGNVIYGDVNGDVENTNEE